MSVFYAAVAILLVAMATSVEASGHYQLNNSSCEYEGKTYQPGDSVETGRCEYCTCYGESINCVIPYCRPPPCVDSEDSDNPKCPDCGRKCPKGENCAGPNGEVIPAGEEGMKIGGQTCRCVSMEWRTALSSQCE